MNFRVRIKNRLFWVSFIPMALLLIKQVAALAGVELNIEGVSQQLVAIVETVFACLALLGVVNDPTTDGLGDSARALTYDKPYKD